MAGAACHSARLVAQLPMLCGDDGADEPEEQGLVTLRRVDFEDFLKHQRLRIERV